MIHWKNICTLSLVHFMAYPELQSGEGNFSTSIHEIGHCEFFDALEIGAVEDQKERTKVRELAEYYGLNIGFGAQPIILSQNLDLNSFDHGEQNNAVSKLMKYIDQAAEVQADRFVILSGKDPGDHLRSDAYKLLAESIIKLGMYAEQYAIKIVLETFDRSVDKRALVGPSDEAAQLAVEIKKSYPQFGLLYDMGHMPLLEEEPNAALKTLGEHLAEVHLGNCVKLSDSPIYGDKHPCFGFAGGVNNTSELVEFIRALFNTGYLEENSSRNTLPWVGFEVRPHLMQTSNEILENIQDTWKAAWPQIFDS